MMSWALGGFLAGFCTPLLGIEEGIAEEHFLPVAQGTRLGRVPVLLAQAQQAN